MQAKGGVLIEAGHMEATIRDMRLVDLDDLENIFETEQEARPL
jgi:hypothetical protein